MNDILLQVDILRKRNDENLYHFILEQLNHESNDIELYNKAVAVIVKKGILMQKMSS